MTRTVIESKTKTVVIGFDEPFCVIGERINPTGRKKLAAELEAGDFTTVERDALEQVACGATVLDVNSGAVFTNKMAEDPRYADNNFVEPPLMRELILALEHAEPGKREAHLTALMLLELQGAETAPLGIPLPRAEDGDKRLRALCEAVLRAPHERATLAEWAHRVGASERTAARLFRDQLGTSYPHWRRQVVLAHALPLLARGTPVGQVAAACGYASESAFGAMVKAQLGQSPSAFFQAK